MRALPPALLAGLVLLVCSLLSSPVLTSAVRWGRAPLSPSWTGSRAWWADWRGDRQPDLAMVLRPRATLPRLNKRSCNDIHCIQYCTLLRSPRRRRLCSSWTTRARWR